MDLKNEGKLHSSSRLDDYGLLITLDECIDNLHGTKKKLGSKTCHLTLCPDTNFSHLHPNIYGPSSLSSVTKLAGGGSGVTVFSGNIKACDDFDPIEIDFKTGKLVMKHGGYKDTKELFALASLSHKLHRQNNYDSNDQAPLCKREDDKEIFLKDFEKRIPQFRMIYISPCHLKRTDLWDSLRLSSSMKKEMSISSKLDSWQSFLRCIKQIKPAPPPKNRVTNKFKRTIKLYEISQHNARVEVQNDSLNFYLPKENISLTGKYEKSNGNGKRSNMNTLSFQYGKKGHGYEALQTLICDNLVPIQELYGWKFTLGQSSIPNDEMIDQTLSKPEIGSILLTQGRLEGEMLDALITEYIQVIKDLQHFTSDQDKYIINELQLEFQELENKLSYTVDDISEQMDAFTGKGIIKNWNSNNGRFKFLYDLGKNFRRHSSNNKSNSDDFFLSTEEKVPAFYLGLILHPQTRMGQIINNDPITCESQNALHSLYQHEETGISPKTIPAWKQLLNYLLYEVKSVGATHRLWNGGLADAGMHNLFLNEKKLWLFDLGEPSLQSLPGFLTKFLFSFFHTLGMEDDGKGSWVNRFDVTNIKTSVSQLLDENNIGKKIQITEKSEKLLELTCDAFGRTLDQFVIHFFDGEHEIRWLLMRYISMQLISDASFCVEKWIVKGGGRICVGNHQKKIEKWLWRALWDLYVATFINSEQSLKRFKVLF